MSLRGLVGLQCSEIEADTSKLVFTGLWLDHKTRILSLEAYRIGRLRIGSEFAARHRYLTGDQVAKLSCVVFLISHQCRVSFCKYFRTSKRAGVARSRPEISMDCVTTTDSQLRSCQPLVSRGYMLRMPLLGHVGATELHVAGEMLRMLRRQAVVRSGGGLLRRNLFALVKKMLLTFWKVKHCKGGRGSSTVGGPKASTSTSSSKNSGSSKPQQQQAQTAQTTTQKQ